MFVLVKPFQSSLMFADKVRRVPERCSIVIASGLAHKHKTKLEKLARDKHSGSIRIFVNYGVKSFVTLGPDCNNISD